MVPHLTAQIKYLRVPDALLDVVKEEQNKVREAARGARGGGGSSRGGRGGAPNARGVLQCLGQPIIFVTFPLQVVDEAGVAEVEEVRSVAEGQGVVVEEHNPQTKGHYIRDLECGCTILTFQGTV